ncbi:MAG: DUF11 domain-containing protein [Deltaproteobacteria bacterium]|uniref:DUF11 domain-containing protein n=1 Tax=Candidatus Zymogenus saltonus TaxID=2844893 RepID=A0A9D8PKG4_9DELT|nr:DUF11 domain-containing protein [Candidatus Zymogenus saltonus]
MNKINFKITIIFLLLICGVFSLAQNTNVTPKNPVISICGEDTFTISVANTSTTTPVTNVVVSAVVPTDFSFRGATNGLPHGSTYSGTSTVTWSSFTLAANDSTPGGDDEWSATITISPNCDAIVGRELIVTVNYDGGGPDTASSGPITVEKPNLVINLEDSGGGSAMKQERAVGDTAEWYVKVRNTGVGDLYNVKLIVDKGAGLTNIRLGAAPGVPITTPYTIDVCDYANPMATGDEETYRITADVSACKDIYLNLKGTYNGCGAAYDVVCGEEVVEGGIELNYKTPNLDYNFTTSDGDGTVDIEFCSYDTVTVNITNTGTDSGKINNLYFDTYIPSELSVSNVTNGITYNSGTGRFEGFPEIAGGGSGSFTFSFQLRWDPFCSPVDCESILFEPTFIDDCGDIFYPPAKELPVGDAPPSAYFTVSKSGPGIVNENGTGTYNFTVTYHAPSTIPTVRADIADTWDSGFSLDTTTPPTPSGYTPGSNFVRWNNQLFDISVNGGAVDFSVTLKADGYNATDCGINVLNTVTFENITGICSGNCSVSVPVPDHSYNMVNAAVLTVIKDGADSLYVNNTTPETYGITVIYDGPLCDLDSNPADLETPPIVVTDTYPGGGVVTNYGSGVLDTGARTLTWTIPASTPLGGPPYTFTLSYDMRMSSTAPGYDPCVCGTIVQNNVTAEILSGTACVLCTDSSSFGIGIECEDLTALFDLDKTWGGATPEVVCESCSTYTNTITFNGPLSLCLESSGSKWNCIDFTEEGANNQVFERLTGNITGQAHFSFYDASTTLTHTTNEDITLGSSINLGFLSSRSFPDPDVGDVLTITYTLCFYTGSVTGRNFDLSTYLVDGYDADTNCGSDDSYHEGVWIEALNNAPSITIPFFCHYITDHCSNLIIECEQSEFRIAIDQDTPSYDVKAVVNLLGNYGYIDDDTDPNYTDPVYYGILNHLNTISGGDPLEPIYDTSTNTLTFNIGDLADPSMLGDGYIQFNLFKICDSGDNITTDITYEDNCTTSYTTSAAYSAPTVWKGDLLVKKTPEVFYVEDRTTTNPTWTIYVTNRGSGKAYNVEVEDTLGAGLFWDSSTVDGTPTAPIIDPNTLGVENTLTWNVGDIDPGNTVEIVLTANVIDCDGKTNDVGAYWGCLTTACAGTAPTQAKVEEVYSKVAITSVTSGPLDICGALETTVSVTFRNIGAYKAFDLVLGEELPTGLEYVLGSSEVSCNGCGIEGVNTDPDDPTANPIEYIFDDTDGMAPGEEYTVKFNVKVETDGSGDPLCNYTVGDDIISHLYYEPPCNVGGDKATHHLDISLYEPYLSITKSQEFGTPGDTVAWRVTITNTGNDVATDVLLTDTLPANVTLRPTNPIVPVGGTPAVVSGSNPWVLVDIPSLTTYTYDIFGVIGSPIICDASRENTAEVEWGCCTTETSSATSTLISIPDLSFETTIGGTGVIDNCGGVIVLTIINDGADGVINSLEDVLPSGFVYSTGHSEIESDLRGVLSSANPSGTTTLTWDGSLFGGIIQSGETITITFEIQHQDWSTGNCYLDPGGNNVATLDWDYDAFCTNTEPTDLTDTEPINPTVPVLEVGKVEEVQTFVPGGPPSTWPHWTITVSETAGGVADGTITIRDTLGPDYDMSSIGPIPIQGINWVLDPADGTGHTLMWTGLSIRANGVGASFSFDLSCDTIASPSFENLDNVVDVSGMCGVACVFAHATDTAYVGPGITKSIVEDEATIGEVVHVDLRVNFFGISSTSYKNIKIQDFLPTGLAFYGNDTYTCTCPTTVTFDSGTMTWDLTDFTSSSCYIDIDFDAYVENISSNQDPLNLTNTVDVDYDITISPTETYSFHDSASDDVDVIEADLEVTKAHVPIGIVDAGDTLSYTISVDHTASSHANAYDVIITDIVPPGLTLGTITPAPANVYPDTPSVGYTTLEWGPVDIANGSFFEVDYDVTVDNDVIPNQILENRTHVEWTSTSGTPTSPAEERTGTGGSLNNYFLDETDSVTVDNVSTITKTLNGAPGTADVTIGDTRTYTIVVELPDATIPTLVITDNLQPGMFYVPGTASITLPNGNPDTTPEPDGAVPALPHDGSVATTLTWNYSSLNASSGGDLTISFDVIVANVVGNQDSPTPTTIDNVARYDLTAGTFTDSGSDDATDLVVHEANIVVTKADNTGGVPVAAGDVITYTLTVTNNGTSTAYDSVVLDTLPGQLNLDELSLTKIPDVSADIAVGNATAGTVTWTIDELLVGDTKTLTYEAKVDSSVIPNLDLTNNVYVTWTSTSGSNTNERNGTDGVGGALNDYAARTDNTVTVETGATIDKTPDGAIRDFTIGVVSGILDVVPYTITMTTLPHATIPTLDISDLMGEGIYYQADSAVLTLPNGTVINSNTGVNAADPALLGPTYDGSTASTIRWSLTSVDASSGGSLIITFNAVVADIDQNDDNDTIPNRATYVYTGSAGYTESASDIASDIRVHVPAFETVKNITNIADKNGVSRGVIDFAEPGDTITYTYAVTNIGSGLATGVTITDTLPAELTYMAGSTLYNGVPAANPSGTNPYTWAIPDIAGGATFTLTFEGVVTTNVLNANLYDNVARVAGEDNLGNTIPTDNSLHIPAGDTDTDDSDNASFTAGVPALTVDKEVVDINGVAFGPGNNSIQPGDYVTYRMRVNNVGDGTAYEIRVVDRLPVGVVYGSGTSAPPIAAGPPPVYSSATWDATSSTAHPAITTPGGPGVNEVMEWYLPTFDITLPSGAGNTLEITYRVYVNSDIVEGLVAENYVTGAGLDGSNAAIHADRSADVPADTDATDDADTTIYTHEPFLVTEKLVTAIDGNPANTTVAVHGSIVDYSYTIENVGLGDAINVNITDTLPLGFEYVAGSANIGDPTTISGRDLIWQNNYTIPPAPAAGSTLTITFQARVTPSAPGGTRINTAVTDGMDRNLQDIIRDGSHITVADTDHDDKDTAEVFIPVNKIELKKEADPTSVKKGGIVRYTVTFRNNRKSTLYNATFTDTMPYGFRYVPGTTLLDGSVFSDPSGSNPYTWNIGTVAPETTVVLKYHAVVTQSAKRGINVNTVVLAVADSSGKIENLTAEAKVSVKGKALRPVATLPGIGGIPIDVGELPGEKIPGEVEEEEKEKKPACCLGVRKVVIKSQDFKNTLPGYPEIYYQTDIAMYGATELFMVNDYLNPLLIAKGIDPEDKYLMTGLYNRIIEKLGEYAQYNLGNVVMKSELGIPFAYSPAILEEAKETGKKPEDVLDQYLLEMAKEAGLSEVPDIDPIFLEYFGSYPYLEDKITDGKLAWEEAFMDKNIMPAALGFTLLRASFQIDKYLKSEDPTDRFFGRLLLAQSMEKTKSAFEELAVTAEFSPPVTYFPHYSRIQIDKGRPGLKYEVVDEVSTLYDHVSMLWGLSKLRSVLIHSTDPKARENIETIDARLKETYKIIEKIHYNADDKTFLSFHGPTGAGSENDNIIKVSDLGFTVLALRSVYNDNRDLRLNSEGPKRKITYIADFMLENLVSKKDGGVYTSYDYSKGQPDTGTRRTLVDNALAIRAFLTAYAVTEDKKYREAALKVYDWMVEELWKEEYLIFVDEEEYDYEVILTPQSIGALIAALRELTLNGDPDNIYDYLDKMSYTTERILDQAQLQLYENRFFPWHAPLTLIPEDPNGRSYIKPIITPIRDKDQTRDLAPILVRKMVLNLTPAGAIASGDEPKVYDWKKWKANLRFDTPELIVSTKVDDTFETDIGMYFSSLIYDYEKNLKTELPTFNPYFADPDIPHYAAYLSYEVAGFNVKNLTLNSTMGIKLTGSDVVKDMAKKRGMSPDEFLKDFVSKRAPKEGEAGKSFAGKVIDKVKGAIGTKERFEDIIYLEYAEGKPYYEEKIEEGWIKEEIDNSLYPSSIAQTMIRQMELLDQLNDKSEKEPSDRLVKDTMRLAVVAKHRFLVDLTEKMKEEKRGYIPHEFVFKWDKELKKEVPVVKDKNSDLFDQVSLIWAIALWNKKREEGLFNEHANYLGDKKVDEELLAFYVKALVDNHYDKKNGTLITGSVDAVKVGMALDILTRIVTTLPEGQLHDQIMEMIKAQADFIMDKMIDGRGVIAVVKEDGTPYNELCEFESIGTHTIPLNALYRTYEVTGDKKYLDTALNVFLKLDEKKWDQQLGLYLSSGTIYDHQGKTKVELSYTNLDLIFTIMLISELQPYMEQEKKILTAYHMITFMNRILEIGSLERYPENNDKKEGVKNSIEKDVYSPQIIRSVKIVVDESPKDGKPCGVFTFLVIMENYCVDEHDLAVNNTLTRMRVEDTLADDFHYVPGTTTINGKPSADPVGSKKLNWYIPSLRYNNRIVLKYQAVADCDIKPGKYENTLDVKSFIYYEGELYPCDELGVHEGVKISDVLWTEKEEEENSICLPCNMKE